MEVILSEQEIRDSVAVTVKRQFPNRTFSLDFKKKKTGIQAIVEIGDAAVREDGPASPDSAPSSE